MISKLLVREVGQREFVQVNGEFETSKMAESEGERICVDGNGEAFQVWELITAKQRVWKLEEIS